MRTLPCLALLLTLLASNACGSDESADEVAQADSNQVSLAGTSPSQVVVSRPPVSAGDTSAPDAPGTTSGSGANTPTSTLFTRAPWRAGDGFRSKSRMDLKLDAELGLGFLSQNVTYDLKEEESLDVSVLEPGEAGELRRQLAYKSRTSTRTLPIVGKSTDERRVHGKTFLVTQGDGEPELERVGGGKVRDKVAAEIDLSLKVLGTEPVFFSVLPQGSEVAVEIGESIDVKGEIARRIVGLPFDELNVDSLRLTFRGTDDSKRAVFDAAASFSGSTALGDGDVSLTANLNGQVIVAADTMRIARVELKGKVKARQTEGGNTMSAKGSGPLTIKRTITAR
jgi:hypothetical protein